MTIRRRPSLLLVREEINFLMTNRLPRQLLTRFMGWFSQIEHPLVRDISIGIWKRFAALDLSDARESEFRSLHDCFTRRLRAGARPLDNDPHCLVSPCDGIVGAFGVISGTQVIQAKGFPYSLRDLLHDPALVEYYRDGTYVTLRLTSSMYHRFHAPCDCQVNRVTYISGDTWNVNPIALKRVEKLFCKNERVLIETTLTGSSHQITLVPVAAILVASVRLLFLDTLLHLRYRGPNVIPCQALFARGEEMGWFQHGSTIIVFAPKGFRPRAGIAAGQHVRMGEALLTVPLPSRR